MAKANRHLTARERVRNKDRRRFSSQDIARRLSWLSYRAVYWGGADEALPPPLVEDCLETAEIIIARLRGCARGLYAVEILLDENAVRPEIGHVREVSGRLLAEASWQLSKFQRHAPDSGHSDDDDWKDSAYQRLMMYSTAYQATQVPDDSDPAALAVESICAWLGDGSKRPSQLLPTDVLEAHVEAMTDADDKTGWLAAVIFGQRQHSKVPKQLQPWKTLGQLLSDWPPCVLGQFSRDDCRKLSALARQWPELNHPEWAEGLREYLFLCGEHARALAFFTECPALLACCKRLEQEPRDRLQELLLCVGEALQESVAFLYAEETDNYHWNHDFVLACKRKLSENLQLRDVPVFHAEQLEGGLQAMSQWYLDIRLGNLDLMRLKKQQAKREHDPNYLFLQRLQDILERDIDVNAALLRRTLATAAGRLSFLTSPGKAVNTLAAWVGHCREACLPGQHGVGPLALALRSLFNTFGRTAPEVSRERILDMAGSYGAEILRELTSRLGNMLQPPCSSELEVPLTQTEENHENLVLLLASVPPEYDNYIPVLFEERLITWLNPIIKNQFDALDEAIEFLATADGRWLALATSERLTWSQLFQLDDISLATRLAQWSRELVKERNCDWTSVQYILNDVLNFASSAQPQRSAFLAHHLNLLYRVFDSAANAADRCADCDIDVLFSYRMQLLHIAFEWEQQGFKRTSGLLDDLLAHTEKKESQQIARGAEPVPWIDRDADIELSVMLSKGHFKRLARALVSSPRQVYPYPVHAATAWRFLEKSKPVQHFLSSLMHRPEDIIRVKLLLQRMALALRLQSSYSLPAAFSIWAAPPLVKPDSLPEEVPKTQMDKLRELVTYREMYGAKRRIPNAISSILCRPKDLQHEHRKLNRKLDEGSKSNTIAVRFSNVKRYLENPDEMQEWIESDLAKELSKQLAQARLRCLEHFVTNAIEQHWSLLVETDSYKENPDWENALLLCMTVTHNRRLIKELLRHVANNEGDWHRRHPLNQRFLNELTDRGVHAERWLVPEGQSVDVAGRRLRLFVEQDPLRILQMGNLFGTCLRVGGEFSYATVANAIEVNKHVVYAEDEHGAIVARKLIAIGNNGLIYGFRSYGKGDWAKIILDNYCKRLADACNARLATLRDVRDAREQDFLLFAKWYFETPEPFDWWIHNTDVQGSISNGLDEKMPELFHECRDIAIRAFLILGDAALPCLKRFRSHMHPNHLRPLRRQTQSALVREYLGESE